MTGGFAWNVQSMNVKRIEGRPVYRPEMKGMRGGLIVRPR
jgi:hypothetical protein